MIKKNEEADPNQTQISLEIFLKLYNQNLPASFPRSTVAILKKFQSAYPRLFKHGDTWSVAQHRKKVMDWLSSHHDLL